jgi:glycosyltransferase involved in cell wall biosynthesis
MRILIFINSITTGGAERQIVQDANLLAGNGHQVTVGFVKDGPLRSQFAPDVELMRIETRSQIIASIKLACFLRKNRFDIILSHMFWANKVAAAAAFFTGHKLIVFEHGLGLWRKWYHLVLVRSAAWYAKAVITCSEANRKIKIQKEKIPASKVHYIPNSFNPTLPDVQPQPDDAVHDMDIFSIGFAGRFNEIKQLHLLVEIASVIREKSNSFRFVLLGDGEEKEAIVKAIEKQGLEKCFQLTGYVTEPLNWLRKFDCFILPSRIEDFSVALLEASFAGLPCLAFDVGGNAEIIHDGITGFVVTPYNTVIMAEKIMRLMKDQVKCKEMGQNAKKYVSQEFSQEKRILNLEKLIRELVL